MEWTFGVECWNELSEWDFGVKSLEWDFGVNFFEGDYKVKFCSEQCTLPANYTAMAVKKIACNEPFNSNCEVNDLLSTKSFTPNFNSPDLLMHN